MDTTCGPKQQWDPNTSSVCCQVVCCAFLPCLQDLRLKVLALRAFNLETMLVGEQVKSKEPIVTQIRCTGCEGLSAGSPSIIVVSDYLMREAALSDPAYEPTVTTSMHVC